MLIPSHFKRVVLFDVETDGLLESVTRIHVLVIRDYLTGRVMVFRQNERENTLPDGLAILADESTLVVAHNGTEYDCEVLRKLYGIVIPWHRQRDTMVLSRLLWPDIKQRDMDRAKKRGNTFPGNLFGSVSLEAWGMRMGIFKGDYQGDSKLVTQLIERGMDPEEARKEAFRRRWERWNQDMEDYCVQDVEVTLALWERILKKEPSGESVLIETQVAYIIGRQYRHGFRFNEQKAVTLLGRLVQRRLELETEVRKVFRPRYLPDGRVFTPARDNKTTGYVAGAEVQKVKLTEFNPGSRDHVALWLKRDFGWEPTEFTNDGKPKVDDDIISKLPYPEAQPLKEYFMVSKRLGQLAEGKEAWLRAVGPDGRIHGRVNTNGAVTGRMTHSKPNMAQVPAGRSPYGHECRELFEAPEGKLLTGADAEALELRDLAGYMAIYDGGAYVKTVLEGDKSQGTDMHSVNARALGLDPKGVYFEGESGRDIAKTFFYAFIYGAGDEKLGYIVLRKWGQAAVKKGGQLRKAFLTNLPALGALVETVKKRAKERGYLIGLDKRHLPVRSQHAALNTLLQACGAIQMKKALCLLDDALQAAGFVPGVHYEFVANVHDEWQIEVDEDKAETVGRMAVQAIRDAGTYFGFRCPLDGAFDVGRNWAETH